MSSRYNHREAEPKWQARWAEADAFAARDDADWRALGVMNTDKAPVPASNIVAGRACRRRLCG